MEYSENALKIYRKLYFNRKENPLDSKDVQYLEHSPEEVHERMSKFLADSEDQKKHFKILLDNKIFRPNTPCMIHAGLHEDNLAACFVINVEDDMNSIIDLWAITSQIYKSGAGAGFRITKLREKNSPLSTGGYASGPAAYIEVNNCVSNTLKAGGKHRRAANMGVLDYDHPDIMELVTIKDTGKLDAFNLSVLVNNNYMKKVLNYKFNFTPFDDSDNPSYNFNIPLISPNKLLKELPKKKLNGMLLWNTIVDKAWRTGDPGLLFLENINIGNPFPNRGLITTTNPCGEVPLFDDSTCVIGSINVNQKSMYPRNKKELLNFEELKAYVQQATRFLDNMIDKTSFIHERFKKNMLGMRPIGLGIMGFADLLVALNIEYGSEESKLLFKDLCYHLNYYTMRTSLDICKYDGKSSIKMNLEEKEYFRKFMKYYGANAQDINDFTEYGIRNCTWTCIAPTGSISISADCNYSFEPLPAIVWEKKLVGKNTTMKFLNNEFETWLDEHIKTLRPNKKFLKEDKEEIIQKIINNNGSLKGLDCIPEEIQKRFRVAHDINPMDKIELQAAGQKYISMAISSTCNLPSSATKKDVEDIFIYAYKNELKGITIYRDGCKDDQPINFGKVTDKKETTKPINIEIVEYQQPIIMKRPIKRSGESWEIETPHGRLFITINKTKEGKLLEIFLQLGKEGGLKNLLMSTIALQISKRIQDGIDPKRVIGDLRGMKEEKFWFKTNDDQEKSIGAESIIDAIGILLQEVYDEISFKEMWVNKQIEGTENIKTLDGGKIPIDIIEQLTTKEFKPVEQSVCKADECPNCGQYTLERTTGCRGGFCSNCFWTNCG